MTARTSKITLASVFFTFFVDSLCWSIVFPIFAPYFLDPNNVLFSKAVTAGTRATIFGFFVAAFSLGQFIGAPVLGEYGDCKGRKKALEVSVLFTLVGLVITAWSVRSHNLWLLFIGRLITGIFAGSLSICLTCISDLSESEKAKVKYFGYLAVTAGLAFILGAFVGGKLSDSAISPIFTPDFPFWIAACLCGLNLLFVCFGFRETSVVDHTLHFHFWECFKNIKEALRTERIKRIYAVYFLFLFAWTIVFQFSPVLVVQNFEFTSSDIGDLALFMGICWAIGSGCLSKILLHFFSSLHILEWCLFIFTILCALIALPAQIYGLLLVVGLCVIVGGLAWPLCAGVISSLAPKHVQGKIMGMSQSIQSFAMALAPAVGGMAAHESMKLPFFLAAGAGGIAIAIYFIFKQKA